MSIPTGLVVLQQVSAQDTAIALAQAASAASHHLMRYGCASCSQITAEHGLRMCSARTFGTGILGSGTGPNTKAIVAVGGGDARRLRAITAPGCWSAVRRARWLGSRAEPSMRASWLRDCAQLGLPAPLVLGRALWRFGPDEKACCSFRDVRTIRIRGRCAQNAPGLCRDRCEMWK